MEKDSLIIVSGGMDSITLLHERKDTIALAVSFGCGSNHNAREIPFARLHCQRLGIRFGIAIRRKLNPELFGGLVLIFIGIKVLLTHILNP